MLPVGTKVVQILPSPITGEVVGYSLDQTTGDRQYLVVCDSKDGTIKQRYFSESELKETK